MNMFDQNVGNGPRTPDAADQAYCAKCVYAAPGRMLEVDYLCDYILVTGKPRGCPPGVHCVKRTLPKPEKKPDGGRTCKRCGAMFNGGPYTTLCDPCRAEVRRQNGIHVAQARWKKKAP